MFCLTAQVSFSVSPVRHRRSVSLAHTAGGRSCGSAFVTFHDAASADAAVRQPRQQINGRLAEVCEYMYCHFVIAFDFSNFCSVYWT
jgi:hypothetical protein